MITSKFNSSPLDIVRARVVIYDTTGNQVAECTCEDVLSEFAVSRVGVMGKFFGFGVCHKLEMVIIDYEKTLEFFKGYYAEIYYGDGEEWDRCYPKLYFDEVTVDRKTDEIKIVAYDKLKQASETLWSDLNFAETSYSLYTVVNRIAEYLGVPLKDDTTSTVYAKLSSIKFTQDVPANLGGNENCRSVLDSAAELVPCVYFINNDDLLDFDSCNASSTEDTGLKTIPLNQIYECETGEVFTLRNVISTTELGETVIKQVNIDGNVDQYIRDNPFIALRDPSEVLQLLPALNQSLTAFKLDWFGDYTLEPCDMLVVIAAEDVTIYSCIHSDTVKFTGTLSHTIQLEWTENGSETVTTPTTISDKVNQTFARVDKVNRQIELVAGKIEEQNESISELVLTTESISASVKTVDEKMNSVSGEIEALTNEVNLAVTEDEVSILVQKTLQEGVDRVVTASKKYTFDDNGLDITSSGSSISTIITEDGMRIYRSYEEVLTADNEGVKAEDLHATTYLIIGNNSRIEDWKGNRTACLWIGG